MAEGDILGVGTAISGIAGALGTAYAANKNLKAQREANAANLQLAREQNDWNLGQWYRENAYNSPTAKLQRLQAAGMNPLFYGLDGVASANQLTSANLANQQAPQLDVGAIGSSLGHLTDSLVAAGQYHLTRRAQDLEERKIEIQEKELGIHRELADQQKKESDKVIEQMNANIDKIAAEKGFTEQQTENAKKQHELMEAERLKVLEEHKSLELDNQQKQMYLDQYADVLAADLEIKKEEAKNLAAAALNYISAKDKNEAETAGIKLENELTQTYGNLDHIGGLVSKGVEILGKIPGVGKVAKAVGKAAGIAGNTKGSHSNPGLGRRKK